MNEIRVVVCGDEGVGKSSLITSLLKEKFVENIQHLLPPVSIPRDYSSSPYTPDITILVDTDSSDIATLQKEIRQADVIWLVYSDNYSYERISLYWLNMFRSLGVNLPVVLCNNKCDLENSGLEEREQAIIDEMIPVLKEFKEVESCIRCSAKLNYNVVQASYLCQRAVTYPISPLYDYKEGELKPQAILALKRVFYLSDKDHDEVLNDHELEVLQTKCFHKTIDINELQKIKSTVEGICPVGTFRGLTEEGFLALNKYYAQTGRHETIWGILRTFHYTDSLSLSDKVLYPKLDVNVHSSVELSPIGYEFLVNLFVLSDTDNDGGLSDQELDNLFKPTPGIPELWTDSNFPRTVVCNEQGYVTLQGWLAQWCMTTFLDYKVTLAYLGYLGFESPRGSVAALRVTKPRKTRTKDGKSYRCATNDRTVFNCFVLGAPKSGKTSLLEAFLERNFHETYSPTIKPRMVVNSVEVKGGKQCYLILEELGELTPAVLENQTRLNQCDILCYTYDSADPDSFQELVDLREKYPKLDELPVVFVALKADLDRQQQRCKHQPDTYTKSLLIQPPLHISFSWGSSLNELFIQLVETAVNPKLSTPGIEQDQENDSINSVVIVASVISGVILASIWYYRGR
ncbi:BA75_03848T0 [Komagataella pastoris]|uniref:Mitochondrial Rho GTPase n=1 Tax=Komagataella pastoris TaxID=4922 RepID=A0A1B2JFX7_PICPA|nr:BA75_03848T0 [Komagataella pastoris]